jgi:hypothetical protein
MPKLPDSIEVNLSYLYRVFCNDKEGLMEIHNTKPRGSFPQNRIITNMAVNGGFNNQGLYWFEQSSLFAAPGENVIVRFSIIPMKFDLKQMDNENSIKFRDPTDSIRIYSQEHLKLIKVENSNFPIESNIELPNSKERWKSLTITFPPIKEDLKNNEYYSVDFVLEAPQTTSPKIQYFGVGIRRGDPNGNYLRIPLIVLPK